AGSANTGDTITGNNQTYNLTALNAGNNVATSWTLFENVSDTGSGTITASAATATVSGANSGSHSLLSGTFAGIGNLSDAGGGTDDITAGSRSGTVDGGTGSTLSYAGNAGPVSVNLATGAATSIEAGTAGGFAGINNVVGSGSANDTLSNSAVTWTVSG